MPLLTIDHRQIEVADGTKVIAAAEQLGIYIPRFCYHPALGSVGACRVCAVKFLEGPVSGIEMSCMIDAQDGMKVSTTDPDAVAFRKYVIECLMINHPHDCPVCDEGGHCLLQDLTVAGGHGRRSYQGLKRTYTDQFLGPKVQHEMNRCIQCYRCVRYYREYSGYKDLGVMGLASRVYFGRFEEGPLESPFSGNLIDICPTGVFTDKPSRYAGRRWDFERSPGTCIHCALGCSTIVCAFHRAVVRQEARFNPDINGHFICDRGRYGFYYANISQRPRMGHIEQKIVPAGQAVAAAAQRIDSIQKEYGISSVAVIGSDRSSLETLAALNDACRTKGLQPPGVWSERGNNTIHAAVSTLSKNLAVSMRQIESADFILVLGADPVNEAPMLALALRQAQRSGGKIRVADPRPVDLPFEFEHTPCSCREMIELLDQTIAGVENSVSEPSDEIKALAEDFLNSRRPVIVCGTQITNPQIVAKAGHLSRSLQQQGRFPGLFFILAHANSYGAAIVFEQMQPIEDILEKIENGEIKAVLFLESDIWEQFSDRKRLEQAINKLSLTIAADCLNNPLSGMAQIHIPTQSVFEAGGTYVNQEGRPQYARPAHAGGLPISITGQGDHPPRTFNKTIPGADILPPSHAVQDIFGLARTNQKDAHGALEKTFPELSVLFNTQTPAKAKNTLRLFAETPVEKSESGQEDAPPERSFEILPTASVLGEEPLSSYSPCLDDPARKKVWISEADAEKMGISAGDQVVLGLSCAPLTLTACLSSRMAAGTLVIPRRADIFWQQFDSQGRFFIHHNAVHINKKE